MEHRFRIACAGAAGGAADIARRRRTGLCRLARRKGCALAHGGAGNSGAGGTEPDHPAGRARSRSRHRRDRGRPQPEPADRQPRRRDGCSADQAAGAPGAGGRYRDARRPGREQSRRRGGLGAFHRTGTGPCRRTARTHRRCDIHHRRPGSRHTGKCSSARIRCPGSRTDRRPPQRAGPAAACHRGAALRHCRRTGDALLPCR